MVKAETNEALLHGRRNAHNPPLGIVHHRVLLCIIVVRRLQTIGESCSLDSVLSFRIRPAYFVGNRCLRDSTSPFRSGMFIT